MRSARTKACSITPKVKRAVYERDNGWCVVCGRPGLPEAHFIPRSHGGLGVEENIVTLCRDCHRRFDWGTKEEHDMIEGIIRKYLKEQYPEWDEERLVYKKWT